MVVRLQSEVMPGDLKGCTAARVWGGKRGCCACGCGEGRGVVARAGVGTVVARADAGQQNGKSEDTTQGCVVVLSLLLIQGTPHHRGS